MLTSLVYFYIIYRIESDEFFPLRMVRKGDELNIASKIAAEFEYTIDEDNIEELEPHQHLQYGYIFPLNEKPNGYIMYCFRGNGDYIETIQITNLTIPDEVNNFNQFEDFSLRLLSIFGLGIEDNKKVDYNLYTEVGYMQISQTVNGKSIVNTGAQFKVNFSSRRFDTYLKNWWDVPPNIKFKVREHEAKKIADYELGFTNSEMYIPNYKIKDGRLYYIVIYGGGGIEVDVNNGNIGDRWIY